MFIYRTNDIEKGLELVDSIRIYKPLFDARDFKKTKAVLSPDGDYIKITEPSTPAYLIKEVDILHDLEGTNQCIPSLREHKIIATDIKTKDWRQTKSTILTLPDDLACKIDHFGNTKGKLKANFRMQKLKVSGSLEQVITFVFWQVAIDREARRLERQDSDDSEDAYDNAAKRMSGLNLNEDDEVF